jgi:hypothetical protein
LEHFDHVRLNFHNRSIVLFGQVSGDVFDRAFAITKLQNLDSDIVRIKQSFWRKDDPAPTGCVVTQLDVWRNGRLRSSVNDGADPLDTLGHSMPPV